MLRVARRREHNPFPNVKHEQPLPLGQARTGSLHEGPEARTGLVAGGVWRLLGHLLRDAERLEHGSRRESWRRRRSCRERLEHGSRHRSCRESWRRSRNQGTSCSNHRPRIRYHLGPVSLDASFKPSLQDSWVCRCETSCDTSIQTEGFCGRSWRDRGSPSLGLLLVDSWRRRGGLRDRGSLSLGLLLVDSWRRRGSLDGSWRGSLDGS